MIKNVHLKFTLKKETVYNAVKAQQYNIKYLDILTNITYHQNKILRIFT